MCTRTHTYGDKQKYKDKSNSNIMDENAYMFIHTDIPSLILYHTWKALVPFVAGIRESKTFKK